MEEKVVLSICIPTYNRKDIVRKLILELLNSKREDFEIIVLDNASTDGTYTEVSKISDLRLKVYFNEKGISAIENGHKALMLGKGKYVMLFNDREIANYKYLDEIIDFLKKDEYSFVYINSYKKWKKIKIFSKGKEARENLSFGGYHPTGLTYNRKLLNKLNLKEYTEYEKINYYPSFFIAYDLVKFEKMVVFPSKFWKLPDDNFKLKRKSFYSDLKKPIYFSPENLKNLLFSISEYIFKDELLKEKERKRLLLKAYSYLYSSSTYKYVYYRSQNKYECVHYGIEPKILNFIDYFRISRKFKKDYIEYLKNRNYMIDLEIKLGIFKATIKSLLGIVKEKIKKVIKEFIKRLRGK